MSVARVRPSPPSPTTSALHTEAGARLAETREFFAFFRGELVAMFERRREHRGTPEA